MYTEALLPGTGHIKWHQKVVHEHCGQRVTPCTDISVLGEAVFCTSWPEPPNTQATTPKTPTAQPLKCRYYQAWTLGQSRQSYKTRMQAHLANAMFQHMFNAPTRVELASLLQREFTWSGWNKASVSKPTGIPRSPPFLPWILGEEKKSIYTWLNKSKLIWKEKTEVTKVFTLFASQWPIC